MDALTQEGEAALAELSEEELLEEELLEEPEVFFTDTMTKELERVIVTAIPSEGAFREKVNMSVVPIPDKSRMYLEAEAALAESGVNYDGMLAYDISFRNEAGDLVEPEASVSITMEITDKALAAVDSDNMDVESLVVTHIGSEATEAVADVADETDGSVTVSMSDDVVDGIAAEFVVDSFSTFVLTWTNDGEEESATIHWGTNEGEEFKEFDSTTTIDISASSVDLAVNIDGYYFAGAKYKTSETADGVVLGDSVIRKGTDGKWSVETVLYDGDGNATNATEPTTIAHDSHIYVYYAVKGGDSGYTPPGPAPATLNDIKPETKKNVKSNNDGTYTIRLDVTGHATEDVKIGANVIVMLDMTYSMRQNDMNGTRIAAAKSALLSLIDTLNPGYDADHPDLNLVNFTLATFGNTMNIDSELSWTQNRTAMENAVRGLSNSPGAMGTNWQGGLSGAETLAEAANNDSELKKNHTYVIFVTDGAPNCWQGHTSSSTGNELDPAALPYAQTAAISLAQEAIFYGVFCGPASGYENLANMVNNAHGAGTINGTSTTAMHDAFSQIAGEIVAGMAAANVTVDDGIPSLSNVSANVTAGEAGGFKYYITPKGGEETEWVEGVPGATYDESNGVTWDLGEAGELQEGWVYSIEFTVWPSQEAYDTIADLNNGVITMTDKELEAAGIAKPTAEGQPYTLKTNTHLNTTFTDPSGHVYDVVKENLVSEAMALPTETIGVQKIWNNKLDQQNPPAGVKLILTKDGKDYLYGDNAIEVSSNEDPDKNWKVDDIYISLGQIKKSTDGSYEILETGHDYEIVEFVGENDYRWELTSEVYHPMVINGTATMLIKDENATGTEGTNYYVIGGTKYKVAAAGDNMLKAWNDRRSWLQIEKYLEDPAEGSPAAPADALFEFTATITDANGDDIWFSVYGPDGIVKDLETNGNPERDKETGEILNNGYFYSASGRAVTVKIQAGWTLR
ncbi:MAG: VWA domain-containing protein, partial [Firmicutes bacterium]|nr:VWA domain-containing protein [Bacillota bacterium]